MKLRSLGLILALITTCSLSARAAVVGIDPVLLTIDLSDPSNAVITATGLNPETDDSSTQEGAGVDLETFLASVASYSTSTGNSSTLTGATNTDTYDAFAIDNVSGSYQDLNLYVSGGSTQTQNFSSSSSAFSGSITVDLSAYVGQLPSIGTTGYIIAGYSRSTNFNILGLWEVVPEPSEYGMYAFLAFAGLVVWRRMSVSRQPLRA